MAWDSDEDIKSVFESFGYTPTEAEIASLRPSFGEGFGGGVATSAVGQYVNFKNQEAEFAKNDPLTALQNQMDTLISTNTNSVTNLSKQLQDTLTSAPELFGSMTPDQITSYLAPLKTSFDTQISGLQGVLASRGLGASSTEANALAEAGTNFQESVLSTGLNIGLTSQKNRADALQAQINNLFQQTGQAIGVKGAAAGQQSQQNLGESNLIGSLPSFLNANSAQMAAFNKALNPDTGGFLDTFNKVTGAINQGVNTVGNIMTLGKNISTPFGGVNQSQPAPTTSSQTNLFQTPTAPNPNTAFMSPQAAQFANTGSTFGS